MKYIHYATVLICSFILLFFCIYGGGFYIYFQITHGFYGEKIFAIHNIPYDNLYIAFFNRFIAVIFWSSNVVCVSLLFLKKINIKTKGVISLVCLIIILLTLFGPKVIEKVFF